MTSLTGRPKLPADRARSRRVSFAVTPAEHAALGRAAAPHLIGQAVRAAALKWAASYRPAPANPASEAAAERRAAARAIGAEVRRVGQLLNQVARVVHSAGRTDGLAERVDAAAAAVAAAERRFGEASASWS